MKLEYFSLRNLTNFSILNLIESEIINGLVCEKIDFPNSLFPDLHAYQFSKENSSGRVIYGLGVDLNPKKAMIKGFVEFHERNAFLEIGVNKGFTSTNGIAGHRFYTLAKDSAISEIIERDSFLIHWYSKTPFLKLKATKDFENYKLILSSEGYEVLFFETFLGFERTTVCFLINKLTLGFVIGLSSGKSEAEEIHKAFSEALVNLYFGSYSKSIDEQQNDLRTRGLATLTDHRCYWLYNKCLPGWVLDSSDTKTLRNNSTKIEVTEVFHTEHSLIHIVGMRALNALVLEVGYITESSLSVLNERLSTKLKQEEIEPHPLP